MNIGVAILSAVVSYLLGAISFSRIITRILAPDTDLENVKLPNADGSEGDTLLTVGATTAAIKLGSRVGCAIGFLDVLKGFIPTLAFKLLYPDQYYFLIASVFAVIGHNWPVYYRFKGGGGMSPTLGGFLAVDWMGTLIANILGMLLGFAVVRDLFFAYVGWTWLMIPWLWIRTKDPVYGIYALAVNMAFFLALAPEIKRYLEARKRGEVDMQQGMEVTPMGRGMLKMARAMGFFKTEKGQLMGLLYNIQKHRLPASAGNKALNLRRLHNMGIRIPVGYVCDWKAYQRYLNNDVSLVEELRVELGRKLDPGKNYAVRSSANIEDSLDRSFAGQFKSVLNVQGVDAVLQAVWSVWSSTQSVAVNAYLERHHIPTQQLSMAVIIQEMVQSCASGVALSRNPVTGADEVVVEAVQGLGDVLVQGGVTPVRWINKWGNWISKAESAFIPLEIVEEIVDKTREITRRLKLQVDIEWAYDGNLLYFLQVREITTLNQRNVYSNHISKEMLPGIIKPLIDSVNIPLVCTMWVRFMTEMIGKTRAKPEELAKSFYYRVYFNMGVLGKVFEDVGMPAESVELMMNVLPDGATRPSMKPTMKSLLRLPNMLRFAIEKWYFAPKMRKALPELEDKLQRFDYHLAESLSEKELLEEISRLHGVVQNVAYYNIVGPILMGMFNSGLKHQLKKSGVDFNNFDLMEGYAEIGKYDPKTYLHDLHREFAEFPLELQEKIRKSTYAEFQEIPNLDDFQAKVAEFIRRFGHLSDNGNDFSSIPWRESPEMILRLISDFVPPKEEGDHKVSFSDIKSNGMMRALYQRAREFRYLREQVSSLYTFGYGLFRYYYLAIGKIFVQRGWLDDPSDIFYLTDAEVKKAIVNDQPLANYRSIVEQHKKDIECYRNIPLPPVIHGDEPPPVQDPRLEKLIGIPTSIGHYTGRVASVRGIQDFPKVKQGDVLVIPYSDVSWTPLFARAGAVVSESGGLLSHSSIVAREYNIPAVVSADGAMRLQDETIVTVNGHTGEVIIHSTDPQENFMPVLEAKEIRKEYKMGEYLVNALAGVDFQVEKGEFIAIMGPSGSGKSTLLHLLGGLDSPTKGNVILAGQPLAKLSERKATLARRHNVGFVFQFFNLLPTLSAEENILLPIIIDGKDSRKYKDRLTSMLELVGLADRRHHKPDQLSGGEQQRVAIARALISQPAILLADEPTGNLDSKTGTSIMELLRRSCNELTQTVIVVTHDAKAAAYADRVIFLRDGVVVEEYKPAPEVKLPERLRGIMSTMEKLEA